MATETFSGAAPMLLFGVTCIELHIKGLGLMGASSLVPLAGHSVERERMLVRAAVL